MSQSPVKVDTHAEDSSELAVIPHAGTLDAVMPPPPGSPILGYVV
jgi:hypothetical protein